LLILPTLVCSSETAVRISQQVPNNITLPYLSMVTFYAEGTNKYFDEGYEFCAMSGDAFLFSQATNEMMEKVKR